MDQIIIDNVSYDPYFFIGVTPDDPLDHISKVYKRKAKLIHPDKLSKEDKKSKKKVEERIKHFKILVACFEYIDSKKKSFTNKHRRKDNDYVQTEDLNVPLKDFDNSESLDTFNDSFERLRLNNPNDFGYQVSNRLEKKEDYENFDYKPAKIFSRNFNSSEFNKAFEYREAQFQSEKETHVIIHKTSDGFNGYNSANLGNCASVSSFNGLLMVGDNFGQSGIGYNDVNYSDYKQSFEAPVNPDKKIRIPENFKGKTKLSTSPLSSSEMKRKLDSQMSHRNQVLTEKGSNIPNFAEQERVLLSRQKRSLREKVDQDKQFILQFQHLYNEQTVNDALNNRLLTSADYQNVEDS
jgi:hypothetical protein